MAATWARPWATGTLRACGNITLTARRSRAPQRRPVSFRPCLERPPHRRLDRDAIVPSRHQAILDSHCPADFAYQHDPGDRQHQDNDKAHQGSSTALRVFMIFLAAARHPGWPRDDASAASRLAAPACRVTPFRAESLWPLRHRAGNRRPRGRVAGRKTFFRSLQYWILPVGVAVPQKRLFRGWADPKLLIDPTMAGDCSRQQHHAADRSRNSPGGRP